MLKNTFSFLLFTSLLLGETLPLQENQVSSAHASYDGKALILEGRVQLNHGLGNISANQAFLQKQEEGKDFPFSLISLEKEVLLSLKNQSEIMCDSAELDFNALKGSLLSSESKQVSYKNLFHKAGKQTVSLQLSSNAIDLQLAKKNNSPSEQTQYEIRSLLAKEKVLIHYAEDFTLEADEAAYYSLEARGPSSHSTLHAYPTKKHGKCTLSYQGESIETESIDIDVDQNELQIKQPKGFLPLAFFTQNQNGKLFFECQNLLWNHSKELLFLKEEVTLKETNLGCLYAKNEITLEQGSSQSKQFIKSIHIDGPSRLDYENISDGWKHTVFCFGSLHIDGIKGQITLASPPEKEKQIRYVDNELCLQSDNAFIEYSEQNSRPVSLTLKGNVTITSSNLEEPLRCGIADRLTYSPDTQTVILAALPKKRVLFSDAKQGISMSALEVHLTKNLSTGETEAKGIGNVKFSLSTEEHALLKAWIPSFKEDLHETK